MNHLTGKILCLILSIAVVVFDSWPITIAFVFSLTLWGMEVFLEERSSTVDETLNKRVKELEEKVDVLVTALQLKR